MRTVATATILGSTLLLGCAPWAQAVRVEEPAHQSQTLLPADTPTEQPGERRKPKPSRPEIILDPYPDEAEPAVFASRG